MTFGRLWPGAAASCAELEAVIFDGDGPWSEESFRAELSSPHRLYVGEVEEPGTDRERVVAYAGLGRAGPAGDAEYEILTVAVAPELRGRGLGRRLTEALLAAADEDPGPVFLEVRTDNAPAIALYESLGFGRMGVRRRYYADGADAWTMVRPAPGAAD
ncbi:ribosomal protein S18-alanine N-acetyltransferase [Corynebacterium sp.]|uniref:ribosomal protein S18-alanine N-acetyltransferase n=1 Tax=Corynebacterium sp. TaxID=1720 RepID=UPI0026DCC5DB|nr:ribosomal protein S18-alanine N-acetyltransferase [Corynebacterium sp.]MDO4610443.1 ribosomal protein S18-alanine N-acetyltransferase [Corynebacterium sp.]